MDVKTYLLAQLDQLRAATRERDDQGTSDVIARLIRDNHPGAREIIAGALVAPAEPRHA